MRIVHGKYAIVAGCLLLVLSSAASAIEWGPRVGLSSDPDQLIAGVQFDAGEIWRHTRFAPNAQLGFGDDVFTLGGAAAMHYLFTGMRGSWTPYAGGELGFIYINFDSPGGGDDSDTELGLSAAGGLETTLSSGNRLNFELRIGFIDAPDLQFHVGWVF